MRKLIFTLLILSGIANLLFAQSTAVDTATLPPVEGPEPSYKVGTFYYSWYGSPQFNGEWVHWTQDAHTPPDDIASDYYPVLGPYSSTDPQVIAQHMTWLRQAGIGVIHTTWWGQNSLTDRAVPLLMDIANVYNIKVTFHIEPYLERSAERLVQDIKYINEHYGNHAAFFRTTRSSYWHRGNSAKGLFFLFAPGLGENRDPVDYVYWREAMDSIHVLPETTMVIGQALHGNMAEVAHFDGIYNYITLQQGDDLNYSWALDLPMGTFFVPGVAPGNSARRIGYPEDTYLPRLDGNTYIEQWNTALSVGIEPFMVNITSFNEWHEGSQIEPAAVNKNDGRGYNYATYEPLPEDGYLTLTRQMIDQFLEKDWEQNKVRFQITTTSDWTSLSLVSGQRWSASELIYVSDEANAFQFIDGQIHLNQSLERANSGEEVEGIADMVFLDPCTNELVVFEIARGNLGWTSVMVSKFLDESYVVLGEFEYSGLGSGDTNTFTFEIPCDVLTAVEDTPRADSYLPTQYSMSSNYPNPFNPETRIQIEIPYASFISLKIYNLSGQEILTVINGNKPPGIYEVTWNGCDKYGNKVSSGVYFYRLESNNFSETRKMILLR